jgi:hypothetical protein
MAISGSTWRGTCEWLRMRSAMEARQMATGGTSYDAARDFVTQPRLPFLRPTAPGAGPDFIIIGTRYAGADWLSNALRAHPAIWQRPIMEVTYFASRYLPHLAPTEPLRRRAEVQAARAWWRENGSSRPEAHAEAHRLLDTWTPSTSPTNGTVACSALPGRIR